MTLTVVLIVTLSTMFTIFSIREHRQGMMWVFTEKALVLAGEAERLILWDDRVAVKKLLDRVVRTHAAAAYTFIEKGSHPYVHTAVLIECLHRDRCCRFAEYLERPFRLHPICNSVSIGPPSYIDIGGCQGVIPTLP